VLPVHLLTDSQTFAKERWPSTKGFDGTVRDTQSFPHVLDSMSRLQSTYEHCAAHFWGIRDDIEAVVETVNQVHVRVSGGEEHALIPFGPSTEAMRGRVLRTIGFRFNDPAAGKDPVNSGKKKAPEQGLGRPDAGPGKFAEEGFMGPASHGRAKVVLPGIVPVCRFHCTLR
jgi:hypothetical protein